MILGIFNPKMHGELYAYTREGQLTTSYWNGVRGKH